MDKLSIFALGGGGGRGGGPEPPGAQDTAGARVGWGLVMDGSVDMLGGRGGDGPGLTAAFRFLRRPRAVVSPGSSVVAKVSLELSRNDRRSCPMIFVDFSKACNVISVCILSFARACHSAR